MKLGDSPFAWAVFDKAGASSDPAAADALQALVAQPGITDLVVIAHGWNNDSADARRLYATLWGNAAAALRAAGRDPAAFAVLGVQWPAKAYDARYDGGEEFVATGGQGGAQALGDAADDGGALDISPERLEEMLAQVAAFVDDAAFAGVAAAARTAAASREETAPHAFFAAAMTALDYDPHEADVELKQDLALFRQARTLDGANDLLAAFSAPRTIDLAPGVGHAQGLGDIVKGVFNGARSGVAWALNKLTYYTMKKRAGLVGQGLARALGGLHPDRALRLHLVGHSFGGRLVTSAAAALDAIPNIEFRSLTLLQAAYSHNGMTQGQGPFAAVIGKPTGAISFTHTHNDKACTVAYPIASRLNGDTAQALGDRNDRYGAMGANGPQLTGAMMAADVTDTAFAPVAGKINRFLADGYVVKSAASDAHNNVTGPECGRLVAATLLA